jgi:UDP-N-acetylglucosamine 2-epimerase (non-hydrolysing)
MKDICAAIKRIVGEFPDTRVIFAVHKNPIVRDIIFPALGNTERVHLIEPPDYIPFIHLLKKAYLVLTDSGGIQEEAPALGKPVLVMRKTTERPEGVAAGTSKLVGTNQEDVFSAAAELLTDADAYSRMARAVNPYGDGHASENIRKVLYNYFNLEE